MIVLTAVSTRVVGTTAKEIFVLAFIVGTIVPTMIVGAAVPTIIGNLAGGKLKRTSFGTDRHTHTDTQRFI